VSYSRKKGTFLSASETLSMHYASRHFLETELAKRGDWTKTVVVTHHLPSARSLMFGKAVNRLDAAYASNLDSLVARAGLWAHGHSHVCADYQIGDCRVISNPRGYMGDGVVRDFVPALAVEV